MSAEGFACLYLPSVAPQSTTPPTVVSADNSVLGGIGSGINCIFNLFLHYIYVLNIEHIDEIYQYIVKKFVYNHSYKQ